MSKYHKKRQDRIKKNPKKTFIIVSEGAKTEPAYFKRLENFVADTVFINLPKLNSKSNPISRLETLKKEINEKKLQKNDEAWIVFDKDNWEDKQLERLYEWAKKENSYGFALSNPKFELWLLLHFKDAKNITKNNLIVALKNVLPNYEKSFNQCKDKFTLKNIKEAIDRAKFMDKDRKPYDKWPRKTGTTVYKLVEAIFNSKPV